MDIDQTQDCCFTHEENWFRYRVGAIILEETGLPYEIDRLAFVHENFFEGGRKYRRAALP